MRGLLAAFGLADAALAVAFAARGETALAVPLALAVGLALLGVAIPEGDR